LCEQKAREIGADIIVGVDEAGRGPIAGPVVAAAVALPRNFDTAGIKDSKKLTSLQRMRAFAKIIEESRAYAVGIVEPHVIDEINILQASFLAMRRALDGLKIDYDFVLVDGNLEIPHITVRQMAVVDGDALSVSIAAASIVAKFTRDQIMLGLAERYPGYGFEKHKGYCTREHLKAIEQLGICPVHRRSFAPVARMVHSICIQPELF